MENMVGWFLTVGVLGLCLCCRSIYAVDTAEAVERPVGVNLSAFHTVHHILDLKLRPHTAKKEESRDLLGRPFSLVQNMKFMVIRGGQ